MTRISFLFTICVAAQIVTNHGQLPLFSGEDDEDDHCNFDCSLNKSSRPVCGTDGRTYDSVCEIEKAKCEGHPVEFKHRGKCPDSARCRAQRANAQDQAKKYGVGVFIPECREDGSYTEVQCHTSSGYCWCVDEAGKPIADSSVPHKRPNCSQSGCSNNDRATFNSNLISILKSEYNRIPVTTEKSVDSENDPLLDTEEKRIIQWKFNQLDVNHDNYLKKKEVRDLKRMAKKIVKPKSCAKSFTKYCDLDHDKKISRSEWSVCLGVDMNNEQVIPADEALGDKGIDEFAAPSSVSSTVGQPRPWEKQLPRLKQDNAKTKDTSDDDPQDCLSVRKSAIENHKQDPASGTYIPNCTADGLYIRAQCHKSVEYCWCVNPKTGKPILGSVTQGVWPDCDGPRKGAKSFKGCSLQRKQEFLDALVQSFVSQMVQDAKNHSSRLVVRDTPTNEQAARWKFASMDGNNNQMLEKKEWKGFRSEWGLFHQGNRHKKRLRKCWRNLPRYCDDNTDQVISVNEWLTCTGITRDSRGSLPLNTKRRGPNPFSTILKSDD